MAFLMLILFLISAYGCSVPMAARESQLYGIAREEKNVKGVFGKKKVVTIKGFRQNELYIEDMAALKESVEKYISLNPGLSEEKKNNLRELKVSEGTNEEEARLLLGEPIKVSKIGKNPYGATELWVYKINKINAFNIFIFPVFFPHEGYYLYFKDKALVAIERRYLRQTIRQGSAPGVNVGGEKKPEPSSSSSPQLP